MVLVGSAAASSSRISSSRAVSVGNGAARGAAGVLSWCRTRSAMPGPKITSPAAIARTARAISSCSAPLSR